MFRITILATAFAASSAAASDVVSGANKSALLNEIASELVRPTANYIYSQDAEELAYLNIDWREVATHYAGCQIEELRKNSSLVDLEIIRFVWIDNKGRENRAARKVKKLHGSEAFSQASAAYAGSGFDCINETENFLKKLKKDQSK
ncbi:MAG: hypothetical protein ABJQ23_19955 [Shimia thalassica]|uniref:hypothetical protein n=1 Tax=Shimia thalassica TaxID=1715693 RepID=UPI00329A0050